MAIREDNKNIVDNMDYKSMKDKMQETNGIKNKMAEIPKDLSYDDAVKTFKMSLDRDPKNVQEVIDFFKNRKLNKKLSEEQKAIV